MCRVSMVGDMYQYRWTYPNPANPLSPTITVNPVTRAEFDALRREVVEMREALTAAKADDIATGQPDCEMADKVAILRKVAEMVGINLDDVLGVAP